MLRGIVSFTGYYARNIQPRLPVLRLILGWAATHGIKTLIVWVEDLYSAKIIDRAFGTYFWEQLIDQQFEDTSEYSGDRSKHSACVIQTGGPASQIRKPRYHAPADFSFEESHEELDRVYLFGNWDYRDGRLYLDRDYDSAGEYTDDEDSDQDED